MTRGQHMSAFIFPSPPTLHTNPQLLSGGSSAWLDSHQWHQSICAHGLGALQGKAQGSTPDQLSQNTKGPGHTEQHSVVIHLSHSIILLTWGKKDSLVRICVCKLKITNLWLESTICGLPAAALRCERPHWARGFWPCLVPGAHWAQSCKAGKPTWTWGRWAGASEQTHAGRCNVGLSSLGQHGHNLEQPTDKQEDVSMLLSIYVWSKKNKVLRSTISVRDQKTKSNMVA